jgi:hypothetical protein
MTMKKLKKRNHTKIALFAGATALMALTPHSHAQSSVDALLNKLEQKGILTVDEAKELKAENQKDFSTDLNKAFNSRFPMPDWVTSYKLYGDFRGRFDEQTADNAAFVDRLRLRYRLRVGLAVNMKDDLQVGFRLGSSDPAGGSYGGNPLSNNSTVQDNGTKKFIYVDAAYGKWTPINDGTWLLAATIGKMDQPFQASYMMFDPDYTPEGAALQTTYKFNDHHSLAFNSAAFVLDEESKSSHDPLVFGAQLVWNAIWTPKLESSLGVTMFDIVNRDMLTTNNVPYVNQGNTRKSNGALVYNYNPVIVSGSATYKLDSFPLYQGAFPIKLAGEFMDNPGANRNNEGYWGGITFGKSGKRGTWDLAYRYQYLEADAWYDQLVDDDNFAYYQSAPIGGGSGIFGGTNVKGHLVKLNYSLTDALMFTFTCYVNDLINPNPGSSKSGALHAMADLMWKF